MRAPSSPTDKKVDSVSPPLNPAPKSKSIQGNHFSPAAKSNALGGGSPKEPKPTSNEFAKPPLTTKSFPMHQPSLPVVTAKPQEKPPERFAQAPGGLPIIGSNNGFGTRSPDPKTDPNKIENSKLDGMLRSGADKAAGTANQIKNDLQKSADDLLKQTSQNAADAEKNAKSSLNKSLNSFGSKPNTDIGLPGPPPAKSFVPPTVNPDFGSRPTPPPNNDATALPSPKDNLRSPGNSSLITPKTTIPPPLEKTAAPSFGARPNAPNPAPQDFSSRQTPSNLPKLPSSSSVPRNSPSSPFGDFNDRNTSQPKEPTAPLRTPPPTNSAANQPSTFPPPPASTPKLSIPPNNERPPSRLSPSSSVTPAPPSDLAKSSPGDRQLEGVQAAAVTVEKLSPREIQVDQAADFELVIKNVGRADAADVRVFDRIPDGTEFVGSSPEPTSQSRSGEIQWNIGKLRPGQEKRIKLQLKPTRPGEIGSVARCHFLDPGFDANPRDKTRSRNHSSIQTHASDRRRCHSGCDRQKQRRWGRQERLDSRRRSPTTGVSGRLSRARVRNWHLDARSVTPRSTGPQGCSGRKTSKRGVCVSRRWFANQTRIAHGNRCA